MPRLFCLTVFFLVRRLFSLILSLAQDGAVQHGEDHRVGSGRRDEVGRRGRVQPCGTLRTDVANGQPTIVF